jgi:hypothetical protein
MSALILKLNYLLFAWYYNRVDIHFHQWTFFKSVKLLIQNYNSELILKSNAHKHNRDLINDLDATRKELHNLKMQQIASPGQMETLNKIFGTDFNDSINN